MKTELKPLRPAFYPKELVLTLPVEPALIDKVHAELENRANEDQNKCFGYFPAMASRDGINTELPICKQFAEQASHVEINNKKLGFNFVRLSLIKQTGDFPFHLDTDAATALTGDVATLAQRKVWRLLINMSSSYPRELSYIDADPDDVELDFGNGYLHCVDEQAMSTKNKVIKIPPRNGSKVHGVLFCSSRVLHTGNDDEHGHFVAGYGWDEV